LIRPTQVEAVVQPFKNLFSHPDTLLIRLCQSDLTEVSNRLEKLRALRKKADAEGCRPDGPRPEEVNRLYKELELVVSLPAWDDLLESKSQVRADPSEYPSLAQFQEWVGRVENLFVRAVEPVAATVSPPNPPDKAEPESDPDGRRSN
jgi:hypothetical protein